MSVAALPLAFDPAERRKYLGCSEIAAALGLSRWDTPLALWNYKMGLAEKEQTEAMEWGNLLEPVIMARWARKMATGLIRPTERDPLELTYTGGWLRGHLDGIAARERTCPDCGTTGTPIVEAKAPGYRTAHFWGDPCTDLVPEDYGAQCQAYMGLKGYEQCDLYACVGGPDWRVYHLHFDRELFDGLVSGARAFWFNHVVKGERPPLDASKATKEYLERTFPRGTPKMFAEPSQEANELADRLRIARAEVAKWTAEKKLTENGLKALIGACSGIAGPDYSMTWSNCKGSISKKAYVAATNELAATLGLVMEFIRGSGLALPDGIETPQQLLAKHIKAGAGYRRFTPKWAKADEDESDDEGEE